jgi:transcriptional regulator with XRE-family HTH domain
MTEADAQALGELIRSARQARGWSPPALARAVGLNQSTIFRLEHGRTAQPSPELLQRLATTLALPLSDLYALAGIPLPSLQPYLRGRYGLSEQDTAKAAAYIERLARGLGGDGSGPAEGADEQPEHQ